MAIRKGVGGPKTKEGKAKSSLNAMKFGVSTFRAIDDDEKQLVEGFTAQLLDYYQPDSPLEIMQLERIALCRAKLARLYEIERTRLQLAKNAISAAPEKLLDQLGVQNSLSKKLALELIEYQSITLPLHLTIEQLELITQELSSFSVGTLSEKEIKRHLPSLYRYLAQHSFVGLPEEAPILEKLQLVLQKLKTILESENPPIGRIAQLLDSLLQKGHASKEEDHDVRDLMLALNPNYVEPPAKSINGGPKIDLAKIESNFTCFADLLAMLRQAEKLVVHYEQSKSLIIKSLVLPQSETDLLLRYQTTWERRLSTEVGEFIELRKHSRS